MGFLSHQKFLQLNKVAELISLQLIRGFIDPRSIDCFCVIVRQRLLPGPCFCQIPKGLILKADPIAAPGHSLVQQSIC